MTLPKEVMEGVKKELEKEKTIKCPKTDCGHDNPKNRLTCEKCGTRLFGDHKSSEQKVISKKTKKVIAKNEKEKKETKVKAKNVKTQRREKEKQEYPPKGSIKDKTLNVIKRHPKGITMGGIQKEMKITYRLDSYTQEFEERKLIKSKMEGIGRVFIPLAA